jgi:hypothetical protein
MVDLVGTQNDVGWRWGSCGHGNETPGSTNSAKRSEGDVTLRPYLNGLILQDVGISKRMFQYQRVVMEYEYSSMRNTQLTKLLEVLLHLFIQTCLYTRDSLKFPNGNIHFHQGKLGH